MQVPLNLTLSSSHVILALGMLKSYAQTGAAEAHCLNGCACANSTLDLRHHDLISMTFWVPLRIAIAPGSEHCLVEVINASYQEARHKVKVCCLSHINRLCMNPDVIV